MGQEAPLFTRREFSRLLVGTAAAFALSGCGENTEAEKKRLTSLRQQHRDAMLTLKDKPLMTDSEFKKISDSLVNSPSPVFQQIGKGVNGVWNTDKKPSYFPDWVSEETVPFVVTYNFDRVSYASLESFGSEQNPKYIRVNPNTQKETIFPYVTKADMGIHLGSPAFSRQEGPATESLYLAKEWIQVMASLACVPGFIDILRYSGYEFLDVATRLRLSDSKALVYAGLSTYIYEAGNENSMLWLLADGLPLAIVASQLDLLLSKGLYLRPDGGVRPFLAAKNFIDQKAYQSARAKINSMVEKWKSIKTPFLPENYINVMFDPEVSKLILDMQKKLQQG